MEDDIRAFKKCLAKFNVHEWQELELDINPTAFQIEDVMANLRVMIEDG